jgi:hypothetical protein
MPRAGYDRRSSWRGSGTFAISSALAVAMIAATPVSADPLTTGSATMAGTAAMAPSREGEPLGPASLNSGQTPRPLLQSPPAPEVSEPPVSAPPPRAPTDAQLQLGVTLRCNDPAGFFPHVAACKGAWHAILPAASAAAGPTASPVPSAAASAETAAAPSTADDPLARAHAAGYASVSDYLSALAAANLADVRQREERDRERRRAAERAKLVAPAEAPKAPEPAKVVTAAPAEPPHLVPPPTRVIAEPEPEPAPSAAPQQVNAAIEPLPPASPAASAAPQAVPEAAKPVSEELAAIGNQAQQKIDRAAKDASKDDARDFEVAWSLSQATDAATKSLVLTAHSKQTSTNGTALAMVDAACSTADKQFSLRAALVNGAGVALIPLTERMQIGDAAMQSAYFHTELDFNKLVLTRGFDDRTMADASADTLLAAKRALYEIKTSQGTVLIKVASANTNLRKVLQACQNRD